MDKNQFEFVRHVYDLDVIEIFLRLKDKVKNSMLLVEGSYPPKQSKLQGSNAPSEQLNVSLGVLVYSHPKARKIRAK